jgi:hypothetical protein
MTIVRPVPLEVNSLDVKPLDVKTSGNDLGRPGRPPALSRRVEVRRTRNYDGSEYLAILIRDPLSAREIARIQRFPDDIDTDPSSRWRHRAGNDG